MNTIIKLSKIILILRAIPKTLYINFRYLPFNQAIKLPIIISHRVLLMERRGAIIIENNVSTGMIKIGFGEVGIFDQQRSRSVIQLRGKIIFKGRANIGHGSKLSVSGELVIGQNFNITAETQFICKERIFVGDNVLISWDVLIMDSDLHEIIDINGETLNKNKEIIIGNNVWIGTRCTLLKGINIKNGTIVAANTLLHSNSLEYSENSIIGGNPINLIKEGVLWKH